MIKVALRDDDWEFCSAFLDELESEPEIEPHLAATDEGFLELVAGKYPDVAVLDCMQPIERGMGLVQKTMRLQPQTRVLVISRIADDHFVTGLSELGTAYYLIKPFEPRALIARIKWIHYYLGSGFDPLYGRNRGPMRQFLAGYLANLGIPPNYKGHRYLIDAILLASQDHAWLNGITKRLYPAVARSNHTGAGHVERSIRYAIDAAWTKGDLEQLQKLFPYAIDPARGKPTNSTFIAKMADIINMTFSLP
ncbi:MAG: response regulator [Firmicutes bacterium]|nr:sporulation initiation factor Spo0A C-terminal domain-containing protein [Bacillota bacterium]NLL88864.1 response regulator [Bacillota bacterium]HKM18368.1 sporulation initiation factor Spo0A C-terminal domain-containing protein [Limnochordia bacterium]